MKMSIRIPFATLSAVVLIAGLFSPSMVLAANTTPDQAVVLNVTNPAASGTLVGSTGGAYQYYQVGYQGGNAPVLFTLTYQPAWGGGNAQFGFNLYGPSSLSFAGQVTGTSGNSATAQYTLANGAAMTVLVQVYNYSNGGSVDYTLTVSGLSGGSAAIITGQNNSTSAQAIPVTTINASMGGAIVGDPAGAFNYYTLHYPGGDTPLSITMNAHPVYSGPGQALGFNVYRQIPSGSSLVATGVVTVQDANSATFSATVSGRSAGTYQLQVLNYWAGRPVSYAITATGLAGPAPAASGNTDSGHAIVLNSAQPGATGSLAGNHGGAFNYYLVAYPGNNSQFNLSITYPSTGGASNSALGFKVYQGGNELATVNPSDDGTGVISGEWGYQNADATTFGIQVFNYDPANAVAAYTLYQVGAQ
jgi:hypothetical protein